MWLKYQAFSVVKFGNQPNQNEDANWSELKGGLYFRPFGFRCTVADGATQTSFSSLWSRILVREIGKQPYRKIENAISTAQLKWDKIISQKELPWHAVEKVKQGAYSTFLWFECHPAINQHYGIWKAVALGDTCIFQIRGNKIVSSFPITEASDFGNNPYALSSRPEKNMGIKLLKSIGHWQKGDTFIFYD